MEGEEGGMCAGWNSIASIGFPLLFSDKKPVAISFPLILARAIGGL